MTVSRTELERLTPEDIAGYLRAAGWQPAGDLNGRATIWEFDDDGWLGDDERLEVVVPVSARFRDYLQRVYEVVRTLSAAEARPEPEILRSLTDRRIDRQYFRLFPHAPSGMIPAADAAEAFQGIRELLIAAAYAEQNPGQAHVTLPKSKTRTVREFPQRALVTTGPGSFVIATHITLPDNQHTLFGEPSDSFERRAIARLRHALVNAQEAAAASHELADLTPFVDRAAQGVSRTLCQGLARLGGADHERPFEVRFSWADDALGDLPDTALRFSPEQVAMLGHAAEDLGQASTREPAEIRGKVRAMDRDHPSDQGWIVVRGSLRTGDVSRRRQVWVPLAPDDYDRALRAHGQGLSVRVAGILTRTGRRTELDPATGYFRVLSE